ncbi:aldo/keto reductase [Oerskovia enterophila]|uniref:L-glyceraldehyde 3-phosphate reductase n=1 Tax=Oerskovia enterophila TaxID=43678 RepID=A0ABX2Y5K2_9CELL|nr:aldo/keto reductase [Oerskovia enterophila]OCI31840.1 L-glyceraldehyde 3-phosphate reductase [Oerskovia enterophila]
MLALNSPVPFVLGTLPFGSRVDRATSYAVLDRFREAGGRHLDTANNYVQWEEGATGDESEVLLAEWFSARPGARDEMVVATKIGARSDPARPGGFPADMEGLSRPAVRAAVEGSLRRLGMERVDFLYAHVMDPATPLEETVAALAELVAEGRVGALGCSNHDLETLSAAHQVAEELEVPGYSAVQQRFTYLQPAPRTDFGVQQVADAELLRYLADRPGCTAVGYSPLLSGAYSRRDRMPAAYSGAGSEARLYALDQVADEHGVSAGQVVLAWMLEREQRVVPVVGVSRVAQLDECLAAAALRLDAEQLARLDRAGLVLQP